MASRYFPDHFDDEQLAALQAAFDDIWGTLKSHDPDRDWDTDNELRTCIAEKLMALASTGVTKPEELRRQGLETLPLNWGTGKPKRSSNDNAPPA